jgi:hypothetical protein
MASPEQLGRVGVWSPAWSAGYLTMRNCTASLARDGFTPDDFRGGSSDRQVDALVVAGPPTASPPGSRPSTKPAPITWQCRQ